MGLPLQFFQHIRYGHKNQLSIRRRPYKDLKLTQLCGSHIQTRLEAFSGFFGKTKMKADTKLIVVMCCQLFDRRPVPRQSWRQTILVGHLVSMFRGNGRSSRRGSLTIFSISSDVNCGVSGAFWSTIEDLSLIYWFSK